MLLPLFAEIRRVCLVHSLACPDNLYCLKDSQCVTYSFTHSLTHWQKHSGVVSERTGVTALHVKSLKITASWTLDYDSITLSIGFRKKEKKIRHILFKASICNMYLRKYDCKGTAKCIGKFLMLRDLVHSSWNKNNILHSGKTELPLNWFATDNSWETSF